MRNKTQKSIISIVLVLALVVSCFAAMPQTNAAEDAIYRYDGTVSNTGSYSTISFTNGAQQSGVYSVLMRLVNIYDSTDVIYALCVNQKVMTGNGATYTLVDMEKTI